MGLLCYFPRGRRRRSSRDFRWLMGHAHGSGQQHKNKKKRENYNRVCAVRIGLRKKKRKKENEMRKQKAFNTQCVCSSGIRGGEVERVTLMFH